MATISVSYRTSKLKKLRPNSNITSAMTGETKGFDYSVVKTLDLSDLNAYFDLVCPVDKTTGLRCSVVDRLQDPTLDSGVRKTIELSLRDMPAQNVGDELSVSDMLAMLPSRYANAFGDLDSYIQYANSYIEKQNQLAAEKAKQESLQTETT